MTKRAPPPAQVDPVESHDRKPLRDSVTYAADEDELLFSLGDAWDMEEE